jgi:hypothetical protein
MIRRYRPNADGEMLGEIGGEHEGDWYVPSEDYTALESKLAAFQYPPEHRVSVAERERDEALRRLEAYQLALGQIAAFVEQQQQSVKSRDVERQDTECPQCGSKAHAGCPVPNSDLA